MALRLCATAALGLCCASVSAQVFGTPQLAATTPALPGATVGTVRAGDFNGDGRFDALRSRSYIPVEDRTTPLQVLLNNGDRTFTEQGSSFFVGGAPGNVGVREILIEDFNRDGRDDIFLADTGMDAPPFPMHRESLLLSRPDGRLLNANANISDRPGFTHSAAAGDIDGDGDLDIFVNNQPGCTPEAARDPYFLINNGSGVFTVSDTSVDTPQGTPCQVYFATADLADVTGDGVLDLLLGAFAGSAEGPLPREGYSAVRKGNGDGTFGLHDYAAFPPRRMGFDSYYNEIAPLDVDGDGDLDLVAGGGGGSASPSVRTIDALINDGTGKFTDASAQYIPASFASTTLGGVSKVLPFDFTGDCRPDLAVEGAISPFEYLARSGSAFADSVVVPAGGSPTGNFDILDVDGDGGHDILRRTGGDEDWYVTPNTATLCAGLASAVAPSSRTVNVGQFATAFLTIANGRNVPAQNCRLIQKVNGVETQFFYRETNPATNVPVGSPLRRFDVPANGFKSFVFAIAPQAAAANAAVDIKAECINMASPAVAPSVNRFSLTGATGAAADIIPIAVTVSGDGVVRVPGANGVQIFVAAAVNVRDTEAITVRARYAGSEIISTFVCETGSNGACLANPEPLLNVTMAANQTRTFTVLVEPRGQALPADFANRRIVLEFLAPGFILRGQASVAVTTG